MGSRHSVHFMEKLLYFRPLYSVSCMNWGVKKLQRVLLVYETIGLTICEE